MQIYVFGALLLALLIMLVYIVRRTLRMIRAREALLAVGPLKWQPWSATEELEQEGLAQRELSGDPSGELSGDAPDGEMAAAEAGAAAVSDTRAPTSAPSKVEPVPGRNSPSRRRQLVSMRETAALAARLWPITPGYFAELEGRLEAAFEALCAEQIDLARYIELIDKEYETAQRLQINLGPLADDALHGEASNAISALEWCRNWALEQMKANEGPTVS